MPSKHYEGIHEAYCPKIDDDRRIKADLVKVYNDSGKLIGTGWMYFNCYEQGECKYFVHKNCPFLQAAFDDLP